MTARRALFPDIDKIEAAAIEVRNVGLVLLKMGEAPDSSLDGEIAAWLGEHLLQAVRRLDEACSRRAGGRP